MRNPRTILGWAVECHRQKAQLSQEELAQIANCRVEEVRDLEKGERLPTLTSLTRISEVFRLTIADMVKSSQNIDTQRH